MFRLNTLLTYPLLLILSIGKRSFEKMGEIIHKSGDTIARILQSSQISLTFTQTIAQKIFSKKKRLFFIIDDTLIKKLFAQYMQGSGLFYDTKIGRRIMAFKLMIGMISDGKYAIPINFAYLFSQEIMNLIGTSQSKNDLIIAFIQLVQQLFPEKNITVLADGLYTNKEILRWCKENGIAIEMRMQSNRAVMWQGKKYKLRDLCSIKGLMPVGRKMARTISVVWHNIDLELTIVRRIDKNDEESIVFQIATYKAAPKEHVANYKARWTIESFIRTTKQELGLQECFSTNLTVQQNHVASVFVAYALAQLERISHKLKNPEAALRGLKKKKIPSLIQRFTFLNQLFPSVHA